MKPAYVHGLGLWTPGYASAGAWCRGISDPEIDAPGVSTVDIDYVNAHGTGTAFNDAMESRAIRATLGATADPIVVSTKGYVGHTLGAAGAIEAVFVLESLRNGWIPASVGAEPLDPGIGLNVTTTTVETDVRLALSNSFAFGGSNVSLVFGAPG